MALPWKGSSRPAHPETAVSLSLSLLIRNNPSCLDQKKHWGVRGSQTRVLDRRADTLVQIGKHPELWKTALSLALAPWPSGASRALTGLSCNKVSERRAVKPGEHQGFREVGSQEQKIGLSWRWSQRSFLSFLKQETRICLRFKERSQLRESEENVECIILPSLRDLLEESARACRRPAES